MVTFDSIVNLSEGTGSGPQGPPGPQGPQGVQGATGPSGTSGVSITNVTAADNGDGTFTLTFYYSDGSTSTVTTPDLTGPPGSGSGATITSITSSDNGDGTFDITFNYDDASSFTITTPDLTGPTGPAGSGSADLGWYFADDYASLQAAINAVPARGFLYIPPGNYTISSPLTCNKQITIMGAGPATQIYMNANDDLLRLGDGSVGIQYCNIKDIWLGSAATTTGKALIKLNRIHDSHFERIGLIGSNIGIHVEGLRNTFYGCYHISNFNLFFGACSNCKTICNIQDAAWGSSNANAFYSCHFRGGASQNYGIYYVETNGEGNILIQGCVIEGLAQAGIYLNGLTQSITIMNCHVESVSGGDQIQLVNCSPAVLISNYCGDLVVTGGAVHTLIGGYYGGISMDANSRHPLLMGIKKGTRTFSVSGKQAEINHVIQTSSNLIDVPGRSNYGGNIIEGTLSSWTGGVPNGLSAYQCSISQETTNKKFGTYSASITLTDTKGGLRRDLTGTEYIAGESISISVWVKAVAGVTPAIFLRFIGPGVDTFSVASGSVSDGSWQRITGTYVMRTDATEVRVSYGIYSGAVGNQAYIDGLELRYGGQVSPVGDGR